MNRKKQILNSYEATTHELLHRVASQNKARVFSKIRIADVLEITSSGLSNDAYGYALKAHFDFVVTDEKTNPLFAVEFDGKQHEHNSISIANGKKKNSICQRLRFPLLRITADFLNRKIRRFTLLSWLTELWFVEQSFYEAQENGSIPYDELFCYFAIASNSLEDTAIELNLTPQEQWIVDQTLKTWNLDLFTEYFFRLPNSGTRWMPGDAIGHYRHIFNYDLLYDG